jgi:7-carboxy-7-deazaguanine synthase
MSVDPDRAGQPEVLTLAVSEIFGPTLQGEGVSIGLAAAFLRLAHCDVGCRWCDTRYSWDFPPSAGRNAEVQELDAADCWDRLVEHLPPGDSPLLVVTGGEPLMQVMQLQPLLRRAKTHGCRVEIETSGTRRAGELTPFTDLFTVSPKLAHSGVPVERRIVPAALVDLAATGRCVFKFVVRGPDDLDEAAAIAAPYPDVPIVVMPLGTSSHQVARAMHVLAGPVAARGWRLSGRLQIDLWGNQRGR